MPLTETQPINIHDLLINNPEENRIQLIHDFKDISREQLKNVELSDPFDTINCELNKKILLGPEYQISDAVLNAFDRQLEFRNSNIDQVISNKFLSKLLGINNESLTSTEVERASNHMNHLIKTYRSKKHYNTYLFFQQLRIIGLNIPVSNEIHRKLSCPMPNNDWSMLDEDKIVAECSVMKVFDLPLPFSRELEYSATFLDESKRYNPDKYIDAIADKMILQADEIYIGENGIELYKVNRNLSPTPPIPDIRNF